MTARAAAATIVSVISATWLWTGSAVAQFGGLFDPPRPPSDVPTRSPAPPPQPAPLQSLPPPNNLLPPGPPPGRSAIQSEDLPAPGAFQPAALPRPGAAGPGAAGPGATATIPPPAPPPQPGAGPVPRPQRGAVPAATPDSNSAVATPATATPARPREDVITQPPAVKIVNPTAVSAGLDKITGRITAFDAAIGETVQFGALQVTARACYSRPPTETPLTDGFIEVDEVTLQGEVRRIFTGWMFAASPGLHAVEHPIYDVWLTDCKGGAPAVADAQPTPQAAASAPSRPAASGQRPTPQRTPAQPAQPLGLRQNLPLSGTLAQPGTYR
jgi:hypothetical protein